MLLEDIITCAVFAIGVSLWLHFRQGAPNEYK